jgi:hypothetical protein
MKTFVSKYLQTYFTRWLDFMTTSINVWVVPRHHGVGPHAGQRPATNLAQTARSPLHIPNKSLSHLTHPCWSRVREVHAASATHLTCHNRVFGWEDHLGWDGTNPVCLVFGSGATRGRSTPEQNIRPDSGRPLSLEIEGMGSIPASAVSSPFHPLSSSSTWPSLPGSWIRHGVTAASSGLGGTDKLLRSRGAGEQFSSGA